MRILFQGDSITDAGRIREQSDNMGFGYPGLVKASLSLDYPQKYEFINKAISGNRVVDVYARIKNEIINLKPDVMSILIGVNDVWHELSPEGPNGIDADKYYTIYKMLIEEVKSALLSVRIMIMEPFVLEGTATTKKSDYFKSEVKKRAKMARRIADEFKLEFIPLQDKFTELATSTKPSYWLFDGVHPTSAGHEMIKREWIKTFEG